MRLEVFSCRASFRGGSKPFLLGDSKNTDGLFIQPGRPGSRLYALPLLPIPTNVYVIRSAALLEIVKNSGAATPKRGKLSPKKAFFQASCVAFLTKCLNPGSRVDPNSGTGSACNCTSPPTTCTRASRS